MSELPRIPPTGPVVGIKPLKRVRKPGGEPKRPDREKPRRKSRDKSESDEDPCQTPCDDGEPGKGGSINLRV